MNALLFALYIEKEFNVRLNVQMFRQETTIQELISAIQQKATS
jgi:acyl carrier protein